MQRASSQETERMRIFKPFISLAVSLPIIACHGPASEEAPELSTHTSSLTSGFSRGCTFALSFKEVLNPHGYVPVVTRRQTPSCAWGEAAVELPQTYRPPELSLIANDLGVAVGYTNKALPSGSSVLVRLEIVHLSPDTLSIQRSAALSTSANFHGTAISKIDLAISADGTTLKARGEKDGNFPEEERWGGRYFVASYPNFFTSSTPPTILVSEVPEAQPVSPWFVTGNLALARTGHTATVLNGTGNVLVVSATSAEVYNPYANASVPTGVPLSSHTHHTATLLGSGKVLVVGGWTGTGPQSASEVYDPATGTWNSAGSLSTPRGHHTATLLGSGKVLVVGGDSTQGHTSSVELYDPATNSWSAGLSAFAARSGHTATPLTSGKVLIVGGTSSSGELRDAHTYDPATNSWSQVAAPPRGRSGHLAIPLYSGLVLVLGGGHDEVDLYNPYNDQWTQNSLLPSGSTAVSATMLYSGEVLVTHSNGQAFLYAPATSTWTSAGTLSAPIAAHVAIRLHTGQVLVTGGTFSGMNVTTVQRYSR
ncbi:uncharacterized protein STAUR_6154 [Stigmatella aurantiaca DW4/3-1]|uniref:Uncharacterized protein n=1 Tax=Stigmatella aurantiaca (strain DW4/3-1) TaxID=378806 RepID=Q08ZA4_STIAD|nr:uncharacterized protein STAUR_6154 [Stigmatella aurantiaca DW4/3-1]EAU65817.1 hypothetical protein STIAU_6222 [Stigmatella aurantiaca DW4/3-1]